MFEIDSFQTLGWPDPFPQPIKVTQGKNREDPKTSAEEIKKYKATAQKLSAKKENLTMLFESHDVNPTKVIADRIQKKIYEQMQAQLA